MEPQVVHGDGEIRPHAAQQDRDPRGFHLAMKCCSRSMHTMSGLRVRLTRSTTIRRPALVRSLRLVK